MSKSFIVYDFFQSKKFDLENVKSFQDLLYKLSVFLDAPPDFLIVSLLSNSQMVTQENYEKLEKGTRLSVVLKRRMLCNRVTNLVSILEKNLENIVELSNEQLFLLITTDFFDSIKTAAKHCLINRCFKKK